MATIELNTQPRRIKLDAGRRAWRASGQGQSRACRVWDEWRRQSEMFGDGDLYIRYGVMGRRFTRELAAL